LAIICRKKSSFGNEWVFQVDLKAEFGFAHSADVNLNIIDEGLL